MTMSATDSKKIYSELRDRLEQAAEEARQGHFFASEDVYANLESKYPWLCEQCDMKII